MVEIRRRNSSHDYNAFRDLVGLEPSLVLFHSIGGSLAPTSGWWGRLASGGITRHSPTVTALKKHEMICYRRDPPGT